MAETASFLEKLICDTDEVAVSREFWAPFIAIFKGPRRCEYVRSERGPDVGTNAVTVHAALKIKQSFSIVQTFMCGPKKIRVAPASQNISELGTGSNPRARPGSYFQVPTQGQAEHYLRLTSKL